VELFTKQLAGILEYVEQIQTLDTSGVPPTAHVMHRPLERDDAATSTLPRSAALANAPDAAAEAGLFKVPRVMG
jgi:aspartyl-tRNA(Asn)/glutamyl-tRNA(Gln) amidotransferase subunit C